jgi:hypothetical protein
MQERAGDRTRIGHAKCHFVHAAEAPPCAMPNKRFQLTQEEGELTRGRRKNIRAYPVSPIEAAKLLCEAHTKTIEAGRGFTVDWGAPPDFIKIDGDLYWEAWRVLREFAGVGTS